MTLNWLLTAYTSFLSLVFLGLLGIAIYPYAKRKQPEVIYKGNQKEKVLVISPCRGVDLTLKKNLSSLKSQTYKNYSVICVVDDLNDPSVPIIKELGLNLIVSDSDIGKGSGKVKAISTAIKKYPEYNVYAIADSDVEFTNYWLERMIAPFSESNVVATTSYPYFNPVGGFWSKVKMVWSFVGNGMMESDTTLFGWGGSLAFRSSLMNSKSLSEFSNSLSDDIYITRKSKSKGKLVYIGDVGLTVNTDDKFDSFMEWSNRQTALTMLGSKSNFKYGVILYSGQELLFFSSIILSISVSYLFLIFLIPFAIGEIKTYMRAPKHKAYALFIFLFINIIYLVNLAYARSMSKISWRGNDYKIVQDLSRQS